MKSNYEIFEEQARNLFLSYDLEEIIRKWDLEADDEYVLISYFGERYRIRRSDRKVIAPDLPAYRRDSAAQGTESGFMAALTIYDVLTRSKDRPALTGQWESLSSLGGVIGAGHEQKLSRFSGDGAVLPSIGQMKKAICQMGGSLMQKSSADLDAVVPVFSFLPMRFQYWEADDEFPASLKYLWDANVLLFMHYETLWYAMGDFDRLLAEA